LDAGKAKERGQDQQAKQFLYSWLLARKADPLPKFLQRVPGVGSSLLAGMDEE
jgi:hypothetical protein